MYINEAIPIYDKEDLLNVKLESFINIAVVHKDSGESELDNEKAMDRLLGRVDSIQKKKTKLRMCDVGKRKDGSVARCVLVEGCPGVGKTTFAHELCKQWARGEILQEWELVVIVKLRDQETREAKTLQDLLYHPYPEVRQTVEEELIDTQGRGTLLILDGYDELSDSQRGVKSVIQQLMNRKLLSQATLMVMSRPIATQELHYKFQRSIDQHIEVLGFTEDNIQEYISSACGSNSELFSDFKSYLSSHPFPSSLMFNPLQCAIVTDLYCSHWKRGDRRFAPNTLTELYTGLLHTLLLRHLTSNPDYSGSHRIRSLSELPEEVQQQVKAITELAARGIENRKYVFDEVDDKVPSETLGLMQREDKLMAGIGRSVSYNFLHLTLQEYFAALKYSNECSSSQQLSELLTEEKPWSLKRFLEHYGKKESPPKAHQLSKYRSSDIVEENIPAFSHLPLLLFIAGRTKLQGISASLLQASLHDRAYSCETIVDVSLLHLLYETQSTELIQSTLITSQRYLSACGNSALDWFVIGFCIANSTSTWKVDKRLHINFQGIDHLPMGLKLTSESNYANNIVCLHIGDNYWLNILKILKWLQPYSISVKEIKLFRRHQKYIEENTEESVPQIDLMQSRHYPALKKIEIELANGNFLFSVLDFQSQPKNDLSLLLYNCNFSIDAISALVHYLQSLRCTKFCEVDVDKCKISMHIHTNTKKEQICSLESLKFESAEGKGKSLVIKGLNKPKISHLVLESFFIMKSHKSGHFKGLSFEKNCYSMTSITKPFACLSSQHNKLHSLSLIKCGLSWKTIDALISFLRSEKCPLRHLELNDNCEVIYGDANHKCKLKLELNACKLSLHISSSSQVIDHVLSSQPHFYSSKLADLKITTEGAIELKTFFPVLEKLKIKGKNTSLFPSFFSLKISSLSTLSLEACSLNHEATMLLIQLLQSPYSRLHHVSLSNCKISFTHKTEDIGGFKLDLKDAEKVSLTVTGSDFFISHILSKLHFYASTLNRLVLLVNSQSTATLENAIANYPILAKLEVEYFYPIPPTHPASQFPVLSIISQQNNLCSLSLIRLSFNSIDTCSLFSFWQDSRLQELYLEWCTISMHSNNSQQTEVQVFILRLQKLSARTVFLHAEDSSSSLFQLLSQPNFYKKVLDVTEMRLKISKLSDSASIVFNMTPYYPMLETLQIDQHISTTLPVVLNFGLQTSSLCFLSLAYCELNNLTTGSLVNFLQSPHCKLCELTLDQCIISFNDDTYQLRLKLKTNENISLKIAGSASAVTCILSQLQFYASKLTELKIYIDHDSPGELNIGISNYSLLETLQFISDQNITLSSSCLNFSSQPNSLHTLSINHCHLSSEAISTLIHSLRSPHCVLSKLMLYCRDIFFKQTLLAAAIFSCSTLKHYLFGGDDLGYSSSLTEMISGIEYNQTIEELTFKNVRFGSDKALVEAVDSSAVQILWMEKRYSSGCLQLSEKINIEIVFYNHDNDPFAKSF